MKHEIIERRAGLMGILIAIVISVGGLVEIVPLYFSSQVTHRGAGRETATVHSSSKVATSTFARVATAATRR